MSGAAFEVDPLTPSIGAEVRGLDLSRPLDDGALDAQARFQCRFRWRPGSVAIWDNRCTRHLALWDDHPTLALGIGRRRWAAAGPGPASRSRGSPAKGRTT